MGVLLPESSWEWVVAIAYPNFAKPETKDCIQDKFHEFLSIESRTSTTKGSVQKYDGAQIAKSSSDLGVLAVTSQNRIDLHPYQGGKEIFQTMAKLIANARHEVLFQTYVWEESFATRTLLEGLSKLHEDKKACVADCQAVQVKLIITKNPRRARAERQRSAKKNHSTLANSKSPDSN